MNKHLIKSLFLYPTHYLRGEPMAKLLGRVTQLEKLSSDELEQYQLSKLKTVVMKGIQQGIYSGIDTIKTISGDEQSPLFLEKLPLLSKSMMRDIHKNSSAHTLKVQSRSTSGSTGQPLQFTKGRLATGYMDAVMYRANTWHGIEPGEPQARFWGRPLDKKSILIAQLKDIIKNRRTLSAFNLSDAAMMEYFDLLEKFRPTHFYGYPSLIAEFAKFIKRRKLSFSFPIKAIIGTGEHAATDTVSNITETFGTTFVNEYGCTEVGVIGFDCSKGNMHLMAQNIYMEVIKDNQSVINQEGEIYVTELNSDHLPFIRYSTGDRGILLKEGCPCGLNYPRIKVVAGRIDDFILKPEGGRVYDAVLAYTLKKGVVQFIANQPSLDVLNISIVPEKKTMSEELLKEYEVKLRESISKKMKITFTLVDHLPREKSGKLRYFRRSF